MALSDEQLGWLTPLEGQEELDSPEMVSLTFLRAYVIESTHALALSPAVTGVTCWSALLPAA